MLEKVFLCNGFSGGGGEAIFKMLYSRYGKAKGCTFTVFGSSEEDGVICLGDNRLAAFFLFARILYQKRPTVVHSHIHYSNMINILLSIVFDYRSQVVVHGFMQYYLASERFSQRLFGRFLIYLYKRADIVVAVSKGLAKELRSFGVDSIIIENTVEYSPKIIERVRKTKTQRIRFGVIGRLHKAKNINLAIKAVARLGWCELLVYGEGEESASLKLLSQELNVDKRVYFCGYSENKDDMYSNIDILISCSKMETFSLVILESLLRGKPVISANCPTGPAEIFGVDYACLSSVVSVPSCGLLFPVGSEDSLVYCMEEVVSNYAAYIPDKYTLKNLVGRFGVNKFFYAYDKLLSISN